MMFPRTQRVILLTLLYCFAAALMCGVWSTAFPRRLGGWHAFELPGRLVAGDDDAAIISSSEIWTAGARSLSSVEDSSIEDAQGITSAEDALGATSEEDLQSTLPLLYHVPEIFALNYNEMTENLRVYIYPNSRTGSKNDSYEYDRSDPAPELQGSEEVTTEGFFNLLARSTFRTSNPNEAHLFLLPVSIDTIHRDLGPEGVGNHLRHYIQNIRDGYKFWDRSLGADHFYLASQGYEAVNHRNYLEFSKNALQVACSPLKRDQLFYPHKDIVLPHYQTLTAPSVSPARSTLAYVNLDLSDSPLMPQPWFSDFDFLIETNNSPASSILASSKFCLSLSMRNVVDALRHGCVPVLVSDSIIYDLPFQDVLNWKLFSLIIGTHELVDVKTRLLSMPPALFTQMQYLGHQASKHMEWHDPPKAFDAFHMTLFELWLRRHSVKYGRRSVDAQ